MNSIKSNSLPINSLRLNSLSLTLACAASLLAHALLLFGQLPVLKLKPATPLQVELRIATPEPPMPPPAESLLKNTLVDEVKPTPPPKLKSAPEPKPTTQAAKPKRQAPARELSLQKKLAQHLYYPPAAIDAGIEGTTHLLLKLDAAGNLIGVSIAASSGHKILDDAAMSAARGMGNLGANGDREMILPVSFRLQ